MLLHATGVILTRFLGCRGHWRNSFQSPWFYCCADAWKGYNFNWASQVIHQTNAGNAHHWLGTTHNLGQESATVQRMLHSWVWKSAQRGLAKARAGLVTSKEWQVGLTAPPGWRSWRRRGQGCGWCDWGPVSEPGGYPGSQGAPWVPQPGCCHLATGVAVAAGLRSCLLGPRWCGWHPGGCEEIKCPPGQSQTITRAQVSLFIGKAEKLTALSPAEEVH